MSLLGYFNLGRASLGDVLRCLPGDLLRPYTRSSPHPEPGDVATEDALDRLMESAAEHDINVLDLRGYSRMQHYPPERWGYFRDDEPKKNVPSRGRAHGTLPWQKRTAIMLHITAVRMGPRRFLGTPCHCAVADDATIVLCHPSNAYVYHGHAANRFSVGVEISSVAGQITMKQTKAARLVVRYIAEDLREHRGAEANVAIMAHRQSHKLKPNDPGAVVWQQVAVPMAEAIDLVPGPVVGSGKPIPPEWAKGWA